MTEAPRPNTFLAVLDTWPEYFNNPHEGLGTTYERFILHRYFERLKKEYQVKSVLEVPSFGMTGISGINSLWWAKQGVAVTVLDNHPERLRQTEHVWQSLNLKANFKLATDFTRLDFDDQSFDLGWNFAALWFIKDLDLFFAELKRVVRKALFICVPNHLGLGYRLRKWSYKNDIPDLFPENIHPRKIIAAAQDDQWRMKGSGYLDIPPWPDIAMKKEDILKKIGLGFLARRNTSDDPQAGRVSIIDWFAGAQPELEKNVVKYDFLEKAPFPVKQIWAHHRYFIFAR